MSRVDAPRSQNLLNNLITLVIFLWPLSSWADGGGPYLAVLSIVLLIPYLLMVLVFFSLRRLSHSILLWIFSVGTTGLAIFNIFFYVELIEVSDSGEVVLGSLVLLGGLSICFMFWRRIYRRRSSTSSAQTSGEVSD